MTSEKLIEVDLVTRSDDPDVTDAFDRITARLGRVANFHRTLANSPALFNNFTGLTRALLMETKVEPLERELAVCCVLMRHRGDYEFAGHSRYALSVGATEEQIANLCSPENDHVYNDRQRAIVRFARRFAADPVERSSLADDNIEAYLDNRQRIELGVILAIYMGMAHFWALFDIPVDSQ